MNINPLILSLRGDTISGEERKENEMLISSRNAFARAFLKTLQAYQLDRSLENHPEVFAMARAFILSTEYENLTNRRLRPPGAEKKESDDGKE
jgi:hypothetical protein